MKKIILLVGLLVATLIIIGVVKYGSYKASQEASLELSKQFEVTKIEHEITMIDIDIETSEKSLVVYKKYQNYSAARLELEILYKLKDEKVELENQKRIILSK